MDERGVEAALAAADRLAHQYVYTPFHEAYWQARGGHEKCTVCGEPTWDRAAFSADEGHK